MDQVARRRFGLSGSSCLEYSFGCLDLDRLHSRRILLIMPPCSCLRLFWLLNRRLGGRIVRFFIMRGKERIRVGLSRKFRQIQRSSIDFGNREMLSESGLT